MKREEVSILVQLVQTLEQAEVELQRAYSHKDYDSFNKMKKFIMSINAKIREVLK